MAVASLSGAKKGLVMGAGWGAGCEAARVDSGGARATRPSHASGEGNDPAPGTGSSVSARRPTASSSHIADTASPLTLSSIAATSGGLETCVGRGAGAGAGAGGRARVGEPSPAR